MRLIASSCFLFTASCGVLVFSRSRTQSTTGCPFLTWVCRRLCIHTCGILSHCFMIGASCGWPGFYCATCCHDRTVYKRFYGWPRRAIADFEARQIQGNDAKRMLMIEEVKASNLLLSEAPSPTIIHPSEKYHPFPIHAGRGA